MKEKREKAGLKLNIQKTKIMSYGPITSWKIDEETMETVRNFILGGSKITFHFHALEKEMATHSSVPAWRIPGMGEPGGLLSMGSNRVGHN